MPKKATPIYLTETEMNHLQSIVQKGTVEARVYKRAKILLLNQMVCQTKLSLTNLI